MSGKSAAFTQADVQRAIRAAKKEGLAKVEVRTRDGGSVIIHIADEKPVATEEQITL
jgi:hypothetical protein